jgi:YidC/Oxa1 family membrane protein insertase
MDKENARNTIIFIVCALALFLVYDYFVLRPAAEQQAQQVESIELGGGGQPGLQAPGVPTTSEFVSVEDALAGAQRITINTPALSGSIAVEGARFDNLHLKTYRDTLDEDSDTVELFRPAGAEHAYFAQFGWTGQNLSGLPDAGAPWTISSENTVLSPGQPVALSYRTDEGLIFTRQIEVDDQFMFTITDIVGNGSQSPVTVAPFGTVQRRGWPERNGRNAAAAEGSVSVLGENGEYRLKMRKHQNLEKDGEYVIPSTGGWLGLTDKYWLAAVIPDQNEALNGRFSATPAAGGFTVYQAEYVGEARTISPGAQITQTRHLFAGAKRAPILAEYSDGLGVPRLIDAIDWGWGYFITKPVFWMIKWFQSFVGNFGIAILMMTVVVKVAFFYPANLSFKSMTMMKKVQPQLEKLKEKHKDDPAALQQNMMKLYRDEKINPLMGCLPMLATIPVFLALFHVLNVTIEMRHAPFFGWIHDLSDRDPTTIWNLYGLIPYNPADVPLLGWLLDGFLHLGVWPLLYGVTMWLTMAMNPPAADPMQRRIFTWMPVIFTFVLAGFPAGLLIYYTWSNVLTIAQQYVIMRRYKVDNPIDGIYRRITGKPDPAK